MTQPLRFYAHIVESPSASDLLDGRIEGRVLSESLRLKGINTSYNLVTNFATLATALTTKVRDATLRFQVCPIIHFSLHGNESGIGLTDETFLDWPQLRSLIAPIGRAMNTPSILCFSSCYGFRACQMAMTTDELPPFGILIGNTASPDWGDAAVAYVTFYHLLSRGSTVPDAVRAMCIASGDDGFRSELGQNAQEDWIDRLRQKNVNDFLQDFQDDDGLPNSGSSGG